MSTDSQIILNFVSEKKKWEKEYILLRLNFGLSMTSVSPNLMVPSKSPTSRIPAMLSSTEYKKKKQLFFAFKNFLNDGTYWYKIKKKIWKNK